MSGSERWARGGRRMRWAVRLGAVMGGVLLVGVVYQAVGAALDRRAAPAPGRMVAVEGAPMHLYCEGEGTPTVVLEAGATGFAQTWGWIQPELARHTRVCSYDRPGLGWSDDAELPRNGRALARRLHGLLGEAGEAGPYVLVGHSLGGTLIRIYTELYPDDVAGLALVDPSHEDQLDRFPADLRRQQEAFFKMVGYAAGLAPTGVLRATNLLGRNAAGLPDRDYRTAKMFASSRTHLRSSARELQAWNETMDAARENRTLGDRPLVVVSATSAMEGMPDGFIGINLEMHEELAGLSSRGRHRLLPGSDHFSLLMDAEDAQQVAGILVDLVVETRRIGTRGGQ